MDEKTQIVLKNAFKRFLKEQLGSMEDKPFTELQVWSLALVELASEVLEQQLNLEDKFEKPLE